MLFDEANLFIDWYLPKYYREKNIKHEFFENSGFQTSGGVPGQDFDMENPNLRSKMKSKRPQGGKKRKNLDYKI